MAEIARSPEGVVPPAVRQIMPTSKAENHSKEAVDRAMSA
jgi:hypothetical protein